MRELIRKNLEYLSHLTKDEADFIEDVLKWDNEQKVAFVLAKRIFEEDLDGDKSKAKQKLRRSNS